MGACSSYRAVAAVGPEFTEVAAPKAASLDLDKSSSCRAFHRQYQLDEKLGEGCFARVYACRRSGDELDAECAVKITDILGHKEEKALLLAQKEATILRRIGDQEHCCRLIDSMSGSRFHYTVLERVSMPLLQGLESMPALTEPVLVDFVRQMFVGVECVHAAGVLHRDVKPDNFLCTWEGTVKLCDFGLAEVLPSGGAGVSGLYGTAPFMAPEMILGQAYGKALDVWSLGVTLYTLVVGQFPYVPERPCVQLMRKAIAHGFPAPTFAPLFPNVDLSQEVVGLLQALLNRNQESRLSVADALEHAWFNSLDTARPSGEPWQCLKATTLESAKWIGAFQVHRSFRQPDGMDKALLELQRKHRLQEQPKLVLPIMGKTSRGTSETSTGVPSPCSSADTRSLGSFSPVGRQSSSSTTGGRLQFQPVGVVMPS